MTKPTKTTLAFFCLTSILSGCSGGSGSGGSTGGASTIGMSVVHTSPATDAIVKSTSTSFQWTVAGSLTVRTTNPYQVKVYSQAACAGTPLSTSFVSATQYNLTGLMHAEVKSIGVTAFDTSDTASAESCSNSVTGDAFIAQVKTTSGSYLGLDVDFSNSMAYLSSNYTGSFFDAYDFSDEANPVKFRTVGSATTPSSTSTGSRGIALYNNGQRLLVGSDTSSKVELWELTGNPRTGTWAKLSEVASLSNVRRIVKVDTTNPAQTVVYVALRKGVAILNIAEPAGTMTLNKKSVNTTDSGSSVVLGNWMLSSMNSDATASLYDITAAPPVINSTYSIPATTAGTALWTASGNSTSTKAFVGGYNGAFFSFDPLNPATPPVMTYRFTSTGATLARDSIFYVENAKEILYTASESKINVWDATSVAAPSLIGQLSLPNGLAGAYGIRVNTSLHRAYVATNGGWFYVINTEMIPAPANAVLPFVY